MLTEATRVLQSSTTGRQWGKKKSWFCHIHFGSSSIFQHFKQCDLMSIMSNISWCSPFVYMCYRLHPKYVHAMNNLGNILKERNELKEAEELLSAAVHVQWVKIFSSNRPKLCVVKLCNLYWFLLCFFFDWIRPDFAAAWMNLGIVQNSLKKFDEAEQSYRNAIRFRKKYPDCYYNLGRLVSAVISL